MPDPHDEADFDIPNTQSVLETFMSKLLKQTEQEYQSLSVLLESLPDPSSSNNVNAITAAAAKEKGQIQLLPIRYGAPSISGKKCQGIYIYMVYVGI